ncbi:MAG: glutamine-hydrolyzing GMP synthase [Sphaerochaeta sp.]
MFDSQTFVDEQLELIRKRVRGKAIIACSGGVDSTVAAALVGKAIGDSLLTIYVDTGLMRKGETEEVEAMFRNMDINYRMVDASAEFFDSLKGVVDPEEKRKIIGELFIRCFEREAQEFGAHSLVQGTIAPDWIESGEGDGKLIKSHHNVGGIPKDLDLELIEPLRDLYKEEVREIARLLGVTVAERQPFPGPGLAIRILGEVTPEAAEIVREACWIVEEELESAAKAEEMRLPWQYFAVLLPTKSVGVRDGGRNYGKTVVIRAVYSADGMDASYAEIPYSVLNRISSRITGALPEISRVVYDVTSKPPGTIEWE